MKNVTLTLNVQLLDEPKVTNVRSKTGSRKVVHGRILANDSRRRKFGDQFVNVACFSVEHEGTKYYFDIPFDGELATWVRPETADATGKVSAEAITAPF